jgi:hypothetical protein
MEPGLVTLVKIVATLVLSMGIVPLIFLFSKGDKTEPEGFGTAHRTSHDHH